MVFGIDDAIVGAGVGAIGNVLGSVIGGNSAADAQAEANRANAEQAALNRDFQSKMSSTAHQREVEDLRKAGLNPILSAHGGASTPSGSMATMNPVNRGAGLAGAAAAVGHSALDIMLAKRDLESRDAAIAESKARALSAATQADYNRVSAYNESLKSGAIRASSGASKATAEIDKAMAPTDSAMNRVLQLIGGAVDAVNIRRILEGTRGAKSARAINEDRHVHSMGTRGATIP